MGYFPTLVSDYQDDTSHTSMTSGYPASAYLTHMANSQFILGLPVLFTGNSTPTGSCGGADGNLATQVAGQRSHIYDVVGLAHHHIVMLYNNYSITQVA